jgi:hypothetical protein
VLLQQLQQFDFVQTLIEKVFAVFDDLVKSASGYKRGTRKVCI